jgi:hypothetical protein
LAQGLAGKRNIPVVEAPQGRRDDFVDFNRAKLDEVVVILKAREPARIMTAVGDSKTNRWHLQIANRWVIQHNFYIDDRTRSEINKFQGQQAAIAIYSMATSRHANAPRGMEFLYSLNRLNVATSRAKCMSLIVGSPQIAEAECHTPRQIQLVNALCRYLEMATPIR